MLVLVTGLPGTGKSTLAEVAGRLLGAPVLAHDWAMSGLRRYPELQVALDVMEPSGHRVVGWSILGALARSQLRRGSSVVLDGVARAVEIDACRSLAEEESAVLVVVATECSDIAVHRLRIEERRRSIPDWHELDWSGVARARRAWEAPAPVDVTLDAVDPLSANIERLTDLLNRTDGPAARGIGAVD